MRVGRAPAVQSASGAAGAPCGVAAAPGELADADAVVTDGSDALVAVAGAAGRAHPTRSTAPRRAATNGAAERDD
ncbi:hypothetical protein GCM10009818_36820 [Nakamurella flavida]